MSAARPKRPAPQPAAAPPFLLDPVLAVILLAAAFLLFWNLGNRDLWQDEAETAMLAKNILRSGLPVVFDGTNLVSTEAGQDFGPGLLWSWSPWVQLYVAAGSMGLFGLEAWAARLPFAFLGLLCLALTYAFARRSFGSQRVARLSAALLGLSVPFVLHCRQARWYALAYLAALGMVFALFEMERRPKTAAAGLAACAVLLFYTNYFVAIGLLAALCLAAPALRTGRSFWAGLAAALAAAAVCCLPGLRFHHVLGKAGPLVLPKVTSYLIAYAGESLTHLLPLPMLALLFWLLRRDARPPIESAHRARALFLLALAGLYVCYVAFGPWLLFRYTTVLLPFCAVLLALAMDRVWAFDRLLAAALLVLLAGTDVLHRSPLGLLKAPGTEVKDRYGAVGPFSSPLAGLLHEITHGFQDCSRALVEHLRANAKPSDVVLTTYGDSPLQFYTGLKVIGGFQGQKLIYDPDWIVMRSTVLDRRPGRDYDVLRFILQRIDTKRCYEKVPLPCQDFMLASCTEPRLHLFREPAEDRPMELWRRTCDASGRVVPAG